MDNITEQMMQQLRSVGFTYPDYEHHLDFGMVFLWQENIYCIGGHEHSNFTDADMRAAAEGLWLPDGSQLLEWLKDNHFSVTISSDTNEKHYQVCAVDSANGCRYTGGGFPLSYALHKVIYKVCKSARRKYCPEHKFRLMIIDE